MKPRATIIPFLLAQRKMSCLFLLILASCGGEKKDLTDSSRKSVLEQIAKETIIPAFESFRSQTDSLAFAVTAFIEKPEKTSLEKAQNQWKATALAWKRASAYSFGPVEDNFLAGSIDYPSVHYPNIEKSIRNTDAIDENYISKQGTSLKGLKALEYLLFKNQDSDQTILEFSSSPKRALYLAALSQNLTLQAQKIIDAWNNGGTPYIETFVNASGRDIKSGLSVLVNKCIQQVNFIRDEHVAMPMGMRNSGEKQPESVHGRLSKTSVDLLKSEIISVKNCFINQSQNGGLNTLLDQVDARYEGILLSKVLSDQFEEVENAASQITLPLDQAIFDESDKVTSLYNALKKLQVLLEVDVVNQLGIILTFSDNDGD